MTIADERRQVLEANDDLVILHRWDLFLQVRHRQVKFGFAREVIRTAMLCCDDIDQVSKILPPLLRGQGRNRVVSKGKVCGQQQDPEGVLHQKGISSHCLTVRSVPYLSAV